MRSGGSKPISRKAARHALGQLLLNARPEKLAELTVERITATHNVSRKDAERMLASAKQQVIL